jgi:RNA polymerase sigma-70 factor, ECF subfamily
VIELVPLSPLPSKRPGGPTPKSTEVSSFDSIYRQYFDFVWASARRLGIGEESIDDVVQEVFIVIHARVHTLEQPDALRSWIYGVVRRTASGHRRTQRSTTSNITFNTEVEAASLRPTPSDLAEQSDKVRLLYSLLDELEATRREVFMLVELDELSVPEAAELLQIPLNTAYSRLRLARQDFEAAHSRRTARRQTAGGQK